MSFTILSSSLGEDQRCSRNKLSSDVEKVSVQHGIIPKSSTKAKQMLCGYSEAHSRGQGIVRFNKRYIEYTSKNYYANVIAQCCARCVYGNIRVLCCLRGCFMVLYKKRIILSFNKGFYMAQSSSRKMLLQMKGA
jgi:hypothetical protein